MDPRRLPRTVELLKKMFVDVERRLRDKDDGQQCLTLDSILSELEQIIDPEDVERLTDLAMGLYDRSDSYNGEVAVTMYMGKKPLFGSPMAGETIVQGARYTTDPKRFNAEEGANGSGIVWTPTLNMDSSVFHTLAAIGSSIPSHLVQDGQLFRTVIKEGNRDPSKYLLLKYIKAEGINYRRVVETNDSAYAQSHGNLGFKPG